MKDLKLRWWQVSIFKLACVAFGVAMGVYFHDFFASHMTFVWLAFIVPAVYISYIYAKK